jgi:hypothetical protein
LKAALRVLAAEPGRRVFVMGDMGELGRDGDAMHAEVGTFARVAGIDLPSTSAVEDISAELRPFVKKIDVSVDPRYGRINRRKVTVVPFKLPAGLVDDSSSG